MKIADCDKEIWEKGEHVFTLGDMRTSQVETWVRMIARESGERVDWHWFGGRAVVKVIGDHEKVRRVIGNNLPATDYYCFTTDEDSVIPMSLFTEEK